MTTYPMPSCLFCKHFDESSIDMRCAAFPNGIPGAITRSQHDHRKPFEGDNGIQFEPIDKEAAEMVEQLFADREGDTP